LEKLRRKFYQQNIDTSFNKNYDGLLEKIEEHHKLKESYKKTYPSLNPESEKILRDIQDENDEVDKECKANPLFKNLQKEKEKEKNKKVDDGSNLSDAELDSMYNKYCGDYKPMSTWELLKRTFLDIEVLSVVLSFVAVYFDFNITMLFLMAKSLLMILRKQGLPKFSKLYWKDFLFLESFHNVIHMALVYLLRDNNDIKWLVLIALGPVFFHNFLGVMDWLVFNKSQWYKMLSIIADPCVDKANRKVLMDVKQYMEILLLGWFVFEMLYFGTSWLFPVLWINFLRVKYMLNDKMAEVMTFINCRVEKVLTKYRGLKPLLFVYSNTVRFLSYVSNRQ